MLRDLVAIPDEVHAGDFVLSLSKGVGEKSTITDYVVTEPLAANFDRDDELLADAKERRARDGDERFIAQLPVGDEEWGAPDWDSTPAGPGPPGRLPAAPGANRTAFRRAVELSVPRA